MRDWEWDQEVIGGESFHKCLHTQPRKVLVNNFAHELPHSKRTLCVCRSTSCTDCRDIPSSSPAGRARVQSRSSGLNGMKQAIEPLGLDQSLISLCSQALPRFYTICMQFTMQGHWPVWGGLRCAWYFERNFCYLCEHVCEQETSLSARSSLSCLSWGKLTCGCVVSTPQRHRHVIASWSHEAAVEYEMH